VDTYAAAIVLIYNYKPQGNRNKKNLLKDNVHEVTNNYYLYNRLSENCN